MDVTLRPAGGSGNITRDDLIKRLGNNLTVTGAFVDKEGIVTEFSVEPVKEANRKRLTFEFKRMKDGSWWHRIPSTSDEGLELDKSVVRYIRTSLGLF